MELVHNDEIVIIWRGPLIEALRFERLDREKEMVKLFRSGATNEKITKVGIPEYGLKTCQALLQLK
jgi:hypothetical protein